MQGWLPSVQSQKKEDKMKITKSRLKEIIKEEVEKVVKEITLPGDRERGRDPADARAVRAGLDSTSPADVEELVKKGLKVYSASEEQIDDLYAWVDNKMDDILNMDDFNTALDNILGPELNEEEVDETMNSGYMPPKNKKDEDN